MQLILYQGLPDITPGVYSTNNCCTAIFYALTIFCQTFHLWHITLTIFPFMFHVASVFNWLTKFLKLRLVDKIMVGCLFWVRFSKLCFPRGAGKRIPQINGGLNTYTYGSCFWKLELAFFVLTIFYMFVFLFVCVLCITSSSHHSFLPQELCLLSSVSQSVFCIIICGFLCLLISLLNCFFEFLSQKDDDMCLW